MVGHEVSLKYSGQICFAPLSEGFDTKGTQAAFEPGDRHQCRTLPYTHVVQPSPLGPNPYR